MVHDRAAAVVGGEYFLELFASYDASAVLIAEESVSRPRAPHKPVTNDIDVLWSHTNEGRQGTYRVTLTGACLGYVSTHG